ncbi:MAG: FHA domain-containing protein [Acidimicrobiia bacterium]|nr:FHA domain-containing protein [Acidimicrobiia bacterium]
MTALTVHTATGSHTIETGPAVLGREHDCDVRCTNPEVSRHHAEVRLVDGHWMLRDLGSSHGTYLNGQRIDHAPVTHGARVVLGGPDTGEQLTFEVAGALAPPPSSGSSAPADPSAAVPPGPPSGPPPGPPAGPPPGPAADPAAAMAAGRTVQVSEHDTSLRVHADRRDYAFDTSVEVVVGRDPAATIVVDNPLVSRRHARVRHDGAHWVLEDLDSAQGTYIHGTRTPRQQLSGVTTAWLGPPDAGEKVLLLTSGPTVEPSPPRRRLPVLLGLLAVLLVAAVVTGVLVVAGGDDEEVADLDLLKNATVRLDLETSQFLSFGSGTIISPEGLILTNAHVVEGHSEPGSELVVSFFEGDDVPVRAAYTAAVVAEDPYLDLALVELGAPLGDDPRRPTDLPFVPLGDSDLLAVGDPLTVLGHPGIAESASLTLTTGTVGSFISDPLLEESRAWINTEAAIAQGNSGGLAANRSGELVAIPTAIRFERGSDGFEERVNRLRPVNLALPMIEAVNAGRRYQPVEFSEMDALPVVERDVDGVCESSSASGYSEEFVLDRMTVGSPLFYGVIADAPDDSEDAVVVDEQMIVREDMFCLSLVLPGALEGGGFVVLFSLDPDYSQLVGQFTF